MSSGPPGCHPGCHLSSYLSSAARCCGFDPLAAKYQLIGRYRAERDLPLSAPEVAQADLAYHVIHHSGGLYYQAQRSDAVERTAREIDIFEATTVPPARGRYRQAG